MAKNNLITIIIIAVIVGALGFFGGMQYQKSKRGSFTPRQFQNGLDRLGGIQTRVGLQGGRPVNGEIISIDEKTITVKTQDGSSKIIIYSDSTNVNKTSEGSMEDLRTGEQIMVIGTEGTGGTVTAQSISIGGNMLLRGLPSGQPSTQSN